MRPAQGAEIDAWRGDLHDGLVGLHRHQRLVGDDDVALGDVPGDDLGLFQTLTEIRQMERSHAYSRTRWTAATTRPRFGM